MRPLLTPRQERVGALRAGDGVEAWVSSLFGNVTNDPLAPPATPRKVVAAVPAKCVQFASGSCGWGSASLIAEGVTLLDGDGRVTNRDYQVTGMPGSFLVDREGKIVYRHVGPMNAETLREKLAELGL